MHWLFSFFYTEAKLGPSDKDKKRLTFIKVEFFEQEDTHFLTTKEVKKFQES
jgi:hypothetical protein